MEEIYKGVTIKYSDSEGEFVAAIGDGYDDKYRNTDLVKVRRYIDNLIKSKFKPISALRRTSWRSNRLLIGGNESPLEKVTITSVAENGDVWIRTDRGRREKASTTDGFYAYTKRNANRVLALMKKIERKKKLEQEILEYFNKFDRLDLSKIAKQMRKLK